MLCEKGLGAKFRSALSNESTTLVGYAFVDDTDLVTSDPGGSKEKIIQKMQHSLDAWEGGLRATGGAIVLEKSHWYLIEFGGVTALPFINRFRTPQQSYQSEIISATLENSDN
jgi:hypothetical protein